MSTMMSFSSLELPCKKIERKTRSGEPVDGSNLLKDGRYTVKIESVGLSDDGRMLRVEFKEKETEKKLYHSIFLTDQNGEFPSYGVATLLRVLVGRTEPETQKYIELISATPTLFGALTGLTCVANVKTEETGFKVQVTPENYYKVVDAGSGDKEELIAELFPGEKNNFWELSELRDAIREYNDTQIDPETGKKVHANCLYEARPQIQSLRIDKESFDENRTALQRAQEQQSVATEASDMDDLGIPF